MPSYYLFLTFKNKLFCNYREFRLWANSTYCDITQTLNFAGLQELVFRSTLENGDCFILLSYQQTYSTQPYRLALQVIEADRICNKAYAQDSEQLIAGVQKNNLGAPIAYHVLKTHPGKLTNEWFVVPACNTQTGLADPMPNLIPLCNRS